MYSISSSYNAVRRYKKEYRQTGGITLLFLLITCLIKKHGSTYHNNNNNMFYLDLFVDFFLICDCCLYLNTVRAGDGILLQN